MADLPLHVDAGRVPHHRAAAHVGISERVQELARWRRPSVCSDLSAQARQLVDYTAQTYESFIAVTLAYMLINLVVMQLMRWVEAKTRLPGYIGGK